MKETPGRIQQTPMANPGFTPNHIPIAASIPIHSIPQQSYQRSTSHDQQSPPLMYPPQLAPNLRTASSTLPPGPVQNGDMDHDRYPQLRPDQGGIGMPYHRQQPMQFVPQPMQTMGYLPTQPHDMRQFQQQ